MIRSTRIKCGMLFSALFTLSLCCVAHAQDSSSSGAMGGLRGPQDILNSVNNRDSYGNPLSGGNPAGAYAGDPAGAASGAPAGSIQPFTPAGSYQGNSAGSAYLPSPTPYNGAPSPYQNGSTPFQGGYPGSNQPPPSYKHHHQHHQKSSSSNSGQYQNQNPNQNQAMNQSPGGYPGQYQNQYQGQPQQDPSLANQNYPNGTMSGPPTATSYNHKGSSNGNSSLGGAAVGVPDRAGKTAVGVSGKAAKEVLKALF